MKKLLCTALAVLLLLLSCGMTALAAAGDEYQVQSAGAKLYADKTSSSQVLEVLRAGTIVRALEEASGFIRTTYNGNTGWIPLVSLIKYESMDASISHIAVTQMPNKTEYYESDRYWQEPFDPTGLEVTAYYKDGTEAVIAPTINAPVMTQSSEKPVAVVVTFRGHTASFFVSIRKHPIKALTLSSLPDKLTYKEGSPLDLTGLRATVSYTDPAWADRELRLDDLKISGYDAAKPGGQTVTLTYKYPQVYTTFQVEVQKRLPAGIGIENLPDMRDYYGQNRIIDLTGLRVMVNYDNGTQKTVTGASCEAEWADTSPSYGTARIRLRYTESGVTQETFYEVNLHELVVTGLRAEGPDKRTYLKGESLDITGLSAYLLYNNGDKKYVTDVVLTPPDMNIVGTQNITVRYGEYTTGFTIAVWSTRIYGDVDLDRQLTAADARLILRYSARLETFNAEQKTVASMGGANATAIEARAALRMSAKLEAQKYIF